jgi:hypothetical protein
MAALDLARPVDSFHRKINHFNLTELEMGSYHDQRLRRDHRFPAEKSADLGT